MDVEFKASFFESVQKVIWYDTKLWKAWNFIKRGLPNFFKNIWRFRKELYNHQWWDYHFTLEMLYRSLSIVEKGISERGIEVDESKNIKVVKMRRALKLLNHKLDNDYVERAELEFGGIVFKPFNLEELENGNYRLSLNETPAEKKHSRKVFKRAAQLEDAEWKELWEIFKGKNFKTIESFDGSDMRTWWD
jgi:hypothetical protein